MSLHTLKSSKSATPRKISATTVITHPTTSTNIDTNMDSSTSDNSDLIPAISRPPKLPAHFAQLL